jgi:hypothetical protein
MFKIPKFAAVTFCAALSASGQGYQPLSREAQQAATLEQQYLNTRSTYESALFYAQKSYRLCMERIQASPNSNPHSCDHYKNDMIKYQRLLSSMTPPPNSQQGYQPYSNPQPTTTDPYALNNQYQQWQSNQPAYQNQNQSPQPQYAAPWQDYQPYASPQPMTTNPYALNNQHQQWQNSQPSNQQQGSNPQIQPYQQPNAAPRPMTTSPAVLYNQYQQWQNQQPWNQPATQNQNSTRRSRRY